ncbi:hypothetical protein [Acidithiobacillus ferridurans]|uniref:hypothetical protein n=1 Tax=Acidithiobacillus ferridurans TaxID=1232575 RepID=UPI001D024CAC|nr:hypothetical protein [Acidithiobacillus ferridurans]
MKNVACQQRPGVWVPFGVFPQGSDCLGYGLPLLITQVFGFSGGLFRGYGLDALAR